MTFQEVTHSISIESLEEDLFVIIETSSGFTSDREIYFSKEELLTLIVKALLLLAENK